MHITIYSKSGGFQNADKMTNQISKDVLTFFRVWIDGKHVHGDEISEIYVTSMKRPVKGIDKATSPHPMNAACDFVIRPAWLMVYFFNVLHRYTNWRIGISTTAPHIHVDHLDTSNGGGKFVEWEDSTGFHSRFLDPKKTNDYTRKVSEVMRVYGVSLWDQITIKTFWLEKVGAENKLDLGENLYSNNSIYKIGKDVADLPAVVVPSIWQTFGPVILTGGLAYLGFQLLKKKAGKKSRA